MKVKTRLIGRLLRAEGNKIDSYYAKKAIEDAFETVNRRHTRYIIYLASKALSEKLGLEFRGRDSKSVEIDRNIELSIKPSYNGKAVMYINTQDGNSSSRIDVSNLNGIDWMAEIFKIMLEANADAKIINIDISNAHDNKAASVTYRYYNDDLVHKDVKVQVNKDGEWNKSEIIYSTGNLSDPKSGILE